MLSTALGYWSNAESVSSIALGSMAQATGTHSIAIGGVDPNNPSVFANSSGDNAIAIGYGAQATGAGSVVLGAGSVASADNVVSVGSGTLGGSYPAYRKIVNVADGVNANDAATVGQLSKLYNAEDLTDANKTAWKTVLGVSAASAISLVNGTNTTVTESNGTYAVNVEASGSVTNGNTGLVSGGTVFSAIDIAKSEVTAATDTKLAAKANTNADNIDVFAWRDQLGGLIADGVAGFVTGDALFDEVRLTADGTYAKKAKTTSENLLALDDQIVANVGLISQNATDIRTNALKIAANETAINSNTTKISDNANAITALQAGTSDLTGLTDAGKTIVRNLAKESVKVVAGTNTTVTPGTEGNATTYAVNVEANGSVTNGNTGLVSGGTVFSAIDIAKSEVTAATDTKLAAKANTNADNIDVVAWRNQLDGLIADGDLGFVTGDALFDEVRLTVDGQYAKKANTTAENLKALDTQILANVNSLATLNSALTNATGIDVTMWSSALGQGTVTNGNGGLVTGGAVYDAIQNISTIASSGATINASNVGKNYSGTDAEKVTNAEAWGNALGTGAVVAGDGQLVTGDTVNTAINTAVANKLDNNLSSLSATGENKIASVAKDVAQSAVTVGNGNHTDVSVLTDSNGNKTYQVNVKTDGKVEDGNTGIVTGDAVYDAIQTVKSDTQASLDTKLDKSTFESYKTTNDQAVADATDKANQAVDTANVAKMTADAAKTTADEAKVIAGDANTNAQAALSEAQKHTTVTSTNNSVTVKETTNTQGGKNYDLSVSLGKDQAFETVSAGQGKNQIVMNGNDGTLKVGNTVTIHGSNGMITGVGRGEVSATSTDAVNGSQLYETQQMIGQNASNIQSLSHQVNKVHDKVKRVGAGAAALAALRPQDFSPDHPISGAAGIGHYDGKQAIAVGMFYRPTENFTVGFGASAAGNDDYMMNAGISYRFGGSGSSLRISQSDINRKVVDLTDQNRALIAQIESSNIREEASAKRLNKVSTQLASTQSALKTTQSALKSTQSELKSAQKKAELSDQKLDMVMKELAALREEIQKMKQK